MTSGSASERIVIRYVRRDDTADVRRINAESLPRVSILEDVDFARLTTGDAVAWVVEVNEVVVGYLIAYLWTSDYGGEEFGWFKQRFRYFVYVDQVALTPDMQGRGIGKSLYAELQRWSERKAVAWITCEVNLDPPNPRSIEFHERDGFAEIQRLTVKDGGVVALLRRQV